MLLIEPVYQYELPKNKKAPEGSEAFLINLIPGGLVFQDLNKTLSSSFSQG